MSQTSQTGAGARGVFLTIEGIEGVGKTTNIDTIVELLEAEAVDYVLTREPGGTPMAEELRELLLATNLESVGNHTELLLMFAARAQHLHAVIGPALDAGKWVVCDRFTDATFAYQGGGRGLSWEDISLLERLVQGELRPDKTLLLDLEPQIGLERARKRADLDRIEQEDLAFFERVRGAYLRRAEADPDRCVIIDAERPLLEVQQSVRDAVLPLLSRAER